VVKGEKMNVDVHVSHNGETYFGVIGTVVDMFLGFEDHGIFSWNLDIDYGNGNGQGTGHRALGGNKKFGHRSDYSMITHYVILHLLHVAGVNQWEELRGKQLLFIKKEKYGLIVGISSLNGSRSFFFEEIPTNDTV
jgi:hypothetical protein